MARSRAGSGPILAFCWPLEHHQANFQRMPGLPLEFTVTGLPRAERAELPELAARMRATYCPALRVGCTAAVVVDPDAKLNWTEGKLLAAATHCIPVVSSAWLTDSLVHGFLLSMGNYVVAPTRTSAATTSVAAVPGPVAPSAAAQATAEAHVPRHAATPASPEKLRGEVRPPPASPRAAPFLEPSATPAAGGSPAGTAQQQLLQQPSHARMLEAAAVQDPLPSPASPAQQRTGSQAAAALLSPLTCSPLPLPDLSPDLLLAAGSKLREAAGSNPRTAPSPRAQELDALNADDEREERQEDGQGAGSSQEQGQVARDGTPNSCSSDALWAARMQQQGEAAGQLNDSPSSYSVGGTDWLGMDSAAATPADSQPGAFRPARTASITMSRHPFVTFNRGTSKVMPSSPAGTPAGSAAGKERGPNATGTFPSTSHFRLGGSSGLLWQLRRHSEGGSSLLGSLSGTGTPERPGSASQGSFSSRGSGGHVLQPVGQHGQGSAGAGPTECMQQQQEEKQVLLGSAAIGGSHSSLRGAQIGPAALQPPPSSCFSRRYLGESRGHCDSRWMHCQPSYSPHTAPPCRESGEGSRSQPACHHPHTARACGASPRRQHPRGHRRAPLSRPALFRGFPVVRGSMPRRG